VGAWPSTRSPTAAPSGPLVSFHLVREPARRTPVALARLGTDRLRLRGTPGAALRPAAGHRAAARPRLPAPTWARTALFAVWDSPAALDAVEAGPLGARMRRTRDRGGEVYAVRLRPGVGPRPVGGHDVLAGLERRDPGDGPLAVLTRAVVRPRAWHRFAGVGPAVSDEVGGAPGLLAVVGVGEAPVGLQATSACGATPPPCGPSPAPTPTGPSCAAPAGGLVRRGALARFSPVASTGTWDGRDPLA
jgi:hypothetical protein